jgi:hypothetical protein
MRKFLIQAAVGLASTGLALSVSYGWIPADGRMRETTILAQNMVTPMLAVAVMILANLQLRALPREPSLPRTAPRAKHPAAIGD